MSLATIMHAVSEPRSDKAVAIVTGAARNIGLAIAKRLQEDGYQVVATVFSGTGATEFPGGPSLVDAAGAEALGRSIGSDVVSCDLVDPGACRDLIAFVGRRYHRLDCLVNNAATWTYGPALSISDDDWRYVLEVNVIAMVRLLREAWPLLRVSPAPRVVNMGSIAADWSGNGVAPYNVSKAAVSALTRSASIELAKDGILVNAIAPGFIETTSNRHELGDESVLARRLALIPTGAPGEPADVANLASFLASPRLKFTTGAVMRIDGGQLAGATEGLIG